MRQRRELCQHPIRKPADGVNIILALSSTPVLFRCRTLAVLPLSVTVMSYSLTELQLAMMKVMWESGEIAVADLHDALRAERKIAQSTVATLLARMEKKGLVTHRQEGRQYLYRALVSEGQVRRSVVAEVSGLFGRLFEGDVTEMVSHLLRESDVERDDLARLKQMIQQREAELNGGEG
jgi:BlaI family transcriptional regulator, penicillinase repressor